jgi:hemoglobin/transferrin/lactoferrin receptor protein
VVESKNDVDDSRSELFEPGGYGIVDLTASYRPLDSLAIRVGLFNLTDKTYWRWSEVRGLSPGDPLVSALSAPGRNAAISFSMQW